MTIRLGKLSEIIHSKGCRFSPELPWPHLQWTADEASLVSAASPLLLYAEKEGAMRARRAVGVGVAFKVRGLGPQTPHAQMRELWPQKS